MADGRSLTGAWIETFLLAGLPGSFDVAPLRGRGLKLGDRDHLVAPPPVAPLRGRGLKLLIIDTNDNDRMSLPYGGVD